MLLPEVAWSSDSQIGYHAYVAERLPAPVRISRPAEKFGVYGKLGTYVTWDSD